MVSTKDLVDQMMEYEMDMLNDMETLELFSGLVKTDMAWSLQGHYGKTADALIAHGWLNQQGDIIKELILQSEHE